MHFIKMHTGTHKRYNTPALHLRASRTRDANDVCVWFVECTVGGVTPFRNNKDSNPGRKPSAWGRAWKRLSASAGLCGLGSTPIYWY